MTKLVVMDASAILALLLSEPGADKLTDEIMEASVISTVNLAEVQARLVRGGYEPNEAWEDAMSLVKQVEPYSEQHARLAGDLILKTQNLGLSLGGRSCLALALSLKAPVYTTEKSWKGLRLGIQVHCIR
jgi:ribonuclease VapC